MQNTSLKKIIIDKQTDTCQVYNVKNQCLLNVVTENLKKNFAKKK